MSEEYRDYGFRSAAESHMHRHFMPQVLKFAGELRPGTRVLDIGCGNGATCGEFLQRGCDVTGIDLSEKGIGIARQEYPRGRFEVIAADEDLLNRLRTDPFDLVVSTEVVEHLYSPRRWAKGAFHAVRPGGKFICTTPYHGYWKNLLISLRGGWDAHANPLWDGGHIKFWSRQTLSALLIETGFTKLVFAGAGRLSGLWMTKVVSATKPIVAKQA